MIAIVDVTCSDYGGISASRLEVLEDRLKDDVIAELREYEGRYAMFPFSTPLA